MLKAQNISFRYAPESRDLFQGFDIEIAPGEVVGLVGETGRGKSSLGKLLAGYLQPYSGSIEVDGRTDALRTGTFCPVQLLFQHPELAVNPRWSIQKILGETSVSDPSILESLGIAPSWYPKYPHELSGGELQRVCIARALDMRTRYLICDEISSMLDGLTQRTLWDVLLGIAKERNLGLLVISHDMALLSHICTRQIHLS